MENARQTLWITASTSAAQPTSSSGYGDLSSAPPRDISAPKLATTRPDRASCSANLDRHRPTSRAKSNSGLFTRVGSFFHRVSYRQRGTEGQRDIYSRP
jgi:hypothetical protein